MDAYTGTIMLFAFTYAPSGWAACDGSLLNIADYPNLYTLLGTTYGGDGVTTFALPDLRGRLPVHSGNGVGLSPRTLAQTGGTETVALISLQGAVHDHALAADPRAPAVGAAAKPGPGVVFATAAGVAPYASAAAGMQQMAAQTIAPAGGGQPHNNMMPTFFGNYCIALDGLYPASA